MHDIFNVVNLQGTFKNEQPVKLGNISPCLKAPELIEKHLILKSRKDGGPGSPAVPLPPVGPDLPGLYFSSLSGHNSVDHVWLLGDFEMRFTKHWVHGR